jgi:hypothetical protein
VDAAKIDALFDLAGELLVMKNGFGASRQTGVRPESAVTKLAGAMRAQHDGHRTAGSELHAKILAN